MERDAYCVRDNGVSVGVVLAGTEVEIFGRANGRSLIYSERHETACWIDNSAFDEPDYIHPADLERTLKWRGLVRRWLPYFPDTLTEELVLSVIYKETKGDPHAVDGTGNDIRLVGAASVGVMGAIPRPHLPCYEQLIGLNGKDEYPCQIYLGMWILDRAIKQAHELRAGRVSLPVSTGIMPEDRVCTSMSGSAVGWLREGEQIEVAKVQQNGAGIATDAWVYSERHGRSCWISLEGVDLEAAPETEQSEITQEDIELGLALYGCSEENVLADNCLPWGNETYYNLVLDVIMPEIIEALSETN